MRNNKGSNKTMGTSPIIQLVSPFVQTLRQDTKLIISVNPYRVQVMRKIFVYDDDDDEIISIEHKIIGSEVVRISDMQVSPPQALTPNKEAVQYYTSYHITACFDADIKKGDILICEDGEKFVVQDIQSLYVEGFSTHNRYRKTGVLGLNVEG